MIVWVVGGLVGYGQDFFGFYVYDYQVVGFGVVFQQSVVQFVMSQVLQVQVDGQCKGFVWFGIFGDLYVFDYVVMVIFEYLVFVWYVGQLFVESQFDIFVIVVVDIGKVDCMGYYFVSWVEMLKFFDGVYVGYFQGDYVFVLFWGQFMDQIDEFVFGVLFDVVGEQFGILFECCCQLWLVFFGGYQFFGVGLQGGDWGVYCQWFVVVVSDQVLVCRDGYMLYVMCVVLVFEEVMVDYVQVDDLLDDGVDYCQQQVDDYVELLWVEGVLEIIQFYGVIILILVGLGMCMCNCFIVRFLMWLWVVQVFCLRINWFYLVCVLLCMFSLEYSELSSCWFQQVLQVMVIVESSRFI